MRKSTQKKIMSIFILLMFGGSSLAYAIISAIPSNRPSAWSARIQIVVDNQQYAIPSGIGYDNGQPTAKVYTTDSTGTLHKSVTGDVTLKDFFNAWNQDFNSTCILQYCNTNTSSMTMFVNGNINTAYENYVVQNRDSISILYG